MISQFIQTSTVSLSELSEKTGINKGYISKIARGYTYKNKDAYNAIYDVIENYGGSVPRYGNVVMYPTGKAKGSWDIWIEDKFAATLCFKNHHDIVKFVKGQDTRLETVKSLMIDDSTFDNLVRVY